MVGRRVTTAAAVAILLSLALAGCLAGSDEGPGPTVTPDEGTGGDGIETVENVTRFEDELGAIPFDAPETSDWVLMTMVAGPDRPLQGFRWVLEEGQPYFENDDWVLDMEMAVMTDDDGLSSIRQVIVQVYQEEELGLGLATSIGRGVWHEVYRTDAGSEQVDYGPPWTEEDLAGQFYFAPEPDGSPIGRSVYIVLAADASEETEMAVAIRAFGSNSEWEQVGEAGDHGFSSLRSRVDNERPKLLERLGSAEGFLFPVYVDFNYLYGDPAVSSYGGYEGWTEDITFNELAPATDQRPIGGARSVAVQYDFDAAQGWGYSYGYYFNTAGGAMLTFERDVHGDSWSTQTTAAPYPVAAYIADEYTGSGGPFAFVAAHYSAYAGFYGYDVVAEGQGGASAFLQVDSASATVVNDLTVLGGLHFAATLEELLGMQGVPYAAAYPSDEGLTPSVGGP